MSRDGPGGSANSSVRRPVRVLAGASPSSATVVAALSICTALSSQQPNSSDTARCNEDSIDRRGLWISGLKLNEASGWLSATQEPGLRSERGGSHNGDAVVQFPRHADPWGKRDAVERAYEARARRAVPPASSADADAQP